jgi:hypothetical protein
MQNRAANSATPMSQAGQTGPVLGARIKGVAGSRGLPPGHKWRPSNCCEGGAVAMTDRSQEITQDNDFRNLARLVSACTLGLWAFGAGLLIGVFLFE